MRPPMMPPPPGMRGMRPLGPRGFLTEEEKNNKPKITMSLIKRIAGYLKPYRFCFINILYPEISFIFPWNKLAAEYHFSESLKNGEYTPSAFLI